MKTLLNAENQPESLQKRKIGLNLVSIIVDRFLLDNNFSLTCSTFRNEASSLIANQHVSKSLLSLENMLDEYICLKEEKASLHQERVALMQEKTRIQMLVRDMQNAVNTFNTSRRPPPPNVAEMNANPAMAPQSRVSTSGVAPVITTPLPPQNMSHIQSLPMRMNTNVEAGNLFAPMISASDRKKRDSQVMDVPTVSKKPRGRPPGRKNNVQGQNILSSSNNTVNKQVISTPCSATQSSAWNCAFGGCISPINVDLDETSEKDLVSSRLDAFDMHESLHKSLLDDDDVLYNFDIGDDISSPDASDMHENLDKLLDDDDVLYNFDMGDISSHDSSDSNMDKFDKEEIKNLLMSVPLY